MEYSVIHLCSMVHGIITETVITLVYRETQLYITLNYRCVKIELKKKKPEEQQAKQSPDSVFILTVKLHEMHL